MRCSFNWPEGTARCPACTVAEARVDGFVSYAPEMAHQGGGFRPEAYEMLAGLEASNFWFIVRNDIIEWAFRTYAPVVRSFMEVGCGTGYVLERLVKIYPQAAAIGTEIFVTGLPYAAQRVKSAHFAQMDARHIPYRDEFDAIGAFDVIEHIEQDDEVLSQVHGALRPGGILVLTVPQHQWLWSAADDYAMHQRRYSAQELHQKLRKAGFELLRSTSFVSTLLPAMMLSRLVSKRKTEQYDPRVELRLHPWMNRLFATLMRFELVVIRQGWNWPWGGSRLVVARKPQC